MRATSQVLHLLLMMTTLWLAVWANQPKTYDCMSNPFLSGCRGISAKRSSDGDTSASSRFEMLGGPRMWQPEMELRCCSQMAAARQIARTAGLGRRLAENPFEDYLDAIRMRSRGGRLE